MKILKKILKYLMISAPFMALVLVILMRSGLFSILSPTEENFYFSDMLRGISIQTQTGSDYEKINSVKFAYPDSIQPRNGTAYLFHQTEFAKAESLFVNPLPASDSILLVGQNRFEIFCSPCHGFDGQASGTVIKKVELKEDEEGFPSPPSYLRPETRALSDARIFHIISSGQNIMFPVCDKLPENERWAIVHWVRKLQSSQK